MSWATDYAMIPPSTLRGLVRWVEEGLTPGHFVTACLENNLQRAVMHADNANLFALAAITKWIYNRCPAGACVVTPGKRLADLGWRGLSPKERELWRKDALRDTTFEDEVQP